MQVFQTAGAPPNCGSTILATIGCKQNSRNAPRKAADENRSDDSRWLDDIEAQGFRNLTVDKLIEVKIHGVDADYIRQIRDAGYDPDADKLIEALEGKI